VRVTNSIFYNDLLQNIQQNMEPMLNSEEQLSTGLKMNKPSDDPADLGTVMSLSALLDQKNSEAGSLTTRQSRLTEADSALGTATNILDRAQTLVEEANNSTSTSGDSGDEAKEVLQLLQEMVDTANITRGTGPGEMFFSFDSTTNTVNQLYPSGSVSSETVSHDTVDPNAIYYDPNVSTTDGSGNSVSTSVFQVLENVYNHLENNLNNQNTSNGTFSNDITQIQAAVSWITASRAQVGAVENRLTNLQTQITTQNLSVTNLIANFRDTDVESTTVKFSEEQATYQAALETSAKVMQISLTNYLT